VLELSIYSNKGFAAFINSSKPILIYSFRYILLCILWSTSRRTAEP